MTIVVEDGTGLSNSESYVSVAEANAYFAARGNTDWDAVDNKEAALRNATDYMIQTYTVRWSGNRAKTAQALDWPRVLAERANASSSYVNGVVYVDQLTVPPEVKRACIELAVKASAAPLTTDLGREILSESVSGAVAVTYAQGVGRQAGYSVVDAILAPLLSVGSSSISLERA